MKYDVWYLFPLEQEKAGILTSITQFSAWRGLHPFFTQLPVLMHSLKQRYFCQVILLRSEQVLYTNTKDRFIMAFKWFSSHEGLLWPYAHKGQRSLYRMTDCSLWKPVVQRVKAMKSSPLLGPFCVSEFLGFSLLKNIARLGVFMFQTSDNSQLCIDSQYSSQ